MQFVKILFFGKKALTIRDCAECTKSYECTGYRPGKGTTVGKLSTGGMSEKAVFLFYTPGYAHYPQVLRYLYTRNNSGNVERMFCGVVLKSVLEQKKTEIWLTDIMSKTGKLI